MKILHLSDTTLSGSPYRLSKLQQKYGPNESRHIVYQRKIFNRVFDCDIVAEETPKEILQQHLDWADVIHYHNRYKRQQIFTTMKLKVPKKPSVIQIHSPRLSEDFSQEVACKIPLAIIAQYHPRQWVDELSFVIPNVVDINDPKYKPNPHKQITSRPVVSYAPSNCNCRGWDDKSYHIVSPVLRKMNFNNEIHMQRLIDMPHSHVIAMKRDAHIGIDEVSTGSYHLSSLEYLSMGIACIDYTDVLTEKVVKDLTGATELPWVHRGKDSFKVPLNYLIQGKMYEEVGAYSRQWMEQYWNPQLLNQHYTDMYKKL